MLLPKRVKHRKHQRGRMGGFAKGGTDVEFGEYGLKALEPGWVTNRQIEAARIAMTRYIKRGGKGSPETWVAVVKPGKVMFELAGVSEPVAREAMRLAMHKLPIKCKFVTREGDLFEG